MSLPHRPRSARAVLPLLLVAVTLTGYYGWIRLDPATGTAVSPLSTAVAGGALLLAVLAYVVLSRAVRRRGRSGDDTVPSDAPSSQDEATAEVPDDGTDPATDDAVDLDPAAVDAAEAGTLPKRVTQLHIKTLESAIEEQSARIAELENASTGGNDLERVLLTVGALRQRVQGDPESESVLNRVEAAVLRLTSSSVPARPALPAPVHGSRAELVRAPAAPAPTATAGAVPPAMVTAVPAVLVEPPPVAAPPVATPPVATPPAAGEPVAPPPVQHVDEPVEEPVAPVPPPPRSTAPIDGPVLPVPPPPVQVATRGSRWRRRGAA